MLTLGNTPHGLRVLLNRGADLMFSIRSTGAAWPAGVQLVLTIGASSWQAEVDGAVASWVLDQTEVDAVADGADKAAALWYVEPGATTGDEVRLLLAKGQAVVNA